MWMIWIELFLFHFIVYSFLGWLIEGFFNLATKGSFIKPNFLWLPLKPMYGLTAALLLALKATLPLYGFLLCVLILPTFVEYSTAFLLDHYLHLKYWDYSECPHQLSGYICLRFSIYWTFLSFILLYALQPLIAALFQRFDILWTFILPFAWLMLCLDFGLTLKSKITQLSTK